MRKSSTFYWLLSDHLGSTSKVANANGALHSQQLYKAWGESRYTSGTLPTRYTYTGQYSYANDFGLVFYGSRFYDPLLSRWASPDSIIPQSQGVLAWDRYSYVNNSPLMYIDPSGHRPEGECEFGCYTIPIDQHHYKNKTRQDILFSRMFKGSGSNGRWTHEDWSFYSNNRQELWSGKVQWLNPDPNGLEGFRLHTERLAAYYDPEEKEQFVRDFSLVFGGISYDTPWQLAAYEARQGPVQPFLYEGNQGLSPRYLDSLRPNENQSHHYAGIFFLGYYTDPEAALIINYARDPDNEGDVILGSRAAGDAYTFRYFAIDLNVLPIFIGYLGSP